MKYFSLFFALLVWSTPVTAQNTVDTDYRVGTTWTYELSPGLFTFPRTLNPIQFSITDITQRNDTLAYRLEITHGETIEPALLMHVAGDDVYFWEPELEQFVLNYQYGSDTPYTVDFSDQSGGGGVGTAGITIDSMIDLTIDNYLIPTQFATILNSGTFEGAYEMEIFAGIGSNFYPKLYLGYGLYDGDFITRLRCFENGTDSVNFVGFPCLDTLAINEVEDDLVIAGLEIFPNPVTDKVLNVRTHSQVADLRFELLNVTGNILQSGLLTTSDNRLHLNYPAGVYFLRLRSGQRSLTRRVLIR